MWSDCNGGEHTDWTIIIFSRQELEQQRRSLRPIKCPTSDHCVPDVDTLAGPALWVTSKSPEVLLHPFTPSTHLMRTIYRESAAVALVTEATFANWHTNQSGPIIERQKKLKDKITKTQKVIHPGLDTPNAHHLQKVCCSSSSSCWEKISMFIA